MTWFFAPRPWHSPDPGTPRTPGARTLRSSTATGGRGHASAVGDRASRDVGRRPEWIAGRPRRCAMVSELPQGGAARVAEWQTRWLQVPVPDKGVEVQLLSRAQHGTPCQLWLARGFSVPGRGRITPVRAAGAHGRRPPPRRMPQRGRRITAGRCGTRRRLPRSEGPSLRHGPVGTGRRGRRSAPAMSSAGPWAGPVGIRRPDPDPSRRAARERVPRPQSSRLLPRLGPRAEGRRATAPRQDERHSHIHKLNRT